MSKSKSEYCIQTVDNALRVLGEFEDSTTFGVSELSRALDLHKNNVFRLLATLQSRGYIEQCPDSDRYRLGASCLRLGRSFARSQDVVQRARPVLKAIVAELHEVAHLAVLREFEVFHLDAEASSLMLQCAPRAGQSLPAHASALGKVLIGCNDETTRREYSQATLGDSATLVARTQDTITDPHKLAAHLQAVGLAGYASDFGECEAGMHCAAVPIFNADNQLVAAVSVSGPAFRLTRDDVGGRVRTTLTAAGERLSRSLGWDGHTTPSH